MSIVSDMVGQDGFEPSKPPSYKLGALTTELLARGTILPNLMPRVELGGQFLIQQFPYLFRTLILKAV